jgi:hypothetical protein
MEKVYATAKRTRPHIDGALEANDVVWLNQFYASRDSMI